MRISSYPKIHSFGHPTVRNIFDGHVVVEEKVDGSQFSFMLEAGGEAVFKSKNAEVFAESPGMFSHGVQSVLLVKDKLNPGWIYRGEYLRAPKHNALSYGRIPDGHVIIWDVEYAPSEFLSREEKEKEAKRLGFEVVPLVFSGVLEGEGQDRLNTFKTWLDRESVLGGVKVEGVVVKNYSQFGTDDKILAAKYVSEAFKETQSASWKKENPKSGDILAQLAAYVNTEARWRKAVERSRDDGTLTNSPKDIGVLIKSIQEDVIEECEEDIKDKLFAWAKKHVVRGCVAGFPEWYKDFLVQQQFED